MKGLLAQATGRWWRLTYPFWVDRELVLYRQRLLDTLGETHQPPHAGRHSGTGFGLLVDGVLATPDSAVTGSGNLVIIGGAGTGKTSLLHYAARQQATNTEGPVPVLVNLCAWRGEPPVRFISEALRALGMPRMAGSLPSLLGEGKITLLLDDAGVALTGAGESEHCAETTPWVAFLSEWPFARFIAACSPSTERAAETALPNATHVYLLTSMLQGLPGVSPDTDNSQSAILDATPGSSGLRSGSLVDLVRHSVDALGLSTAWLDPLGRLALATLSSPCVKLSDLDEATQITIRETAGLGILAITHPGSHQVRMRSWSRAYLAALALSGTGLNTDGSCPDHYVNNCRAWPALVLWSDIVSVQDREVWLRRLVSREDEAGLLLGLAAIAAQDSPSEGSDALVSAFLRHLQNRPLGSHWAGAACLGDWFGDRCVPLLLSLLGQATFLQKAQIIMLLGDIGGIEAVRALANQLPEPNDDLAAISVDRALLESGSLAANLLVGRLDDPVMAVREHAAALLSRIGRSAIAPLAAKLGSMSEQVREASAAALGAIGALAVPSILAALRSEVAITRGAAVSAMQALEDPSSVPYLLDGIRDESSMVRKSALLALLRVARRGAVGYLAPALRDSDEEIRVAVLESLDTELSLLLVQDLVAVLRDPEQRVRVLALGILVTLASAAVVPLVTAFRDDNWDASSIATRVIERIGAEAISPLRQSLADPQWRTRLVAAKALQWVRHIDAVGALGDGLHDRSSRVREAAVTSLGRLRFRDGVPGLVTALADRNRQVRRAAARSLGDIAAPQATRALVDTLADPDSEVRDQAIVALSQIGSPAVPELVGALGEGDWRSQRAAADALRLIGDRRAVPALKEILVKGDWRVKETAAEALGQLGDQSAVQALLALLAEKRDSVRWKAVDALVKIGSPAIPGLLSLLRSTSWTPRWAAVAALGRIGEAALPALMTALISEEEQVRWAAEAALGQVGDPAIPLLSAALYDREPRTRRAAIEALSQIGTPRAKATLDEYWMASWTRR